MKQIDQLREKSKKPGAPIINGKNSSITKDGLPKLQNKAESNPNLHKQSTIRNSRKIGRIRSTSNDDQSNKRLPSNVSSLPFRVIFLNFSSAEINLPLTRATS